MRYYNHMAYKDNGSGSFVKSFRYALKGIVYAFVTERHMMIHSLMAIIVIFCGYYFHVNKFEWLILLLVIAMVLTLEMVNTAIEKVVDLVTDDYHVLAKYAKDVAAGAVLLASLFAIVIGCIIFIPYI